MNDWSRGYVADEPYTVSYQAELAPAHLDLACRMMGAVWEPAPDMAICEIGCGRGYAALLLAAADPRRTVVGIDYNPAHIAEARAFAAEAGIGNAVLLDADLAELGEAEIARLPDFDLVYGHGIWTWVGDPVREGIIRLLRRKLKPGGILHLTYNALPGFARDLPLQRLIRSVASLLPGGSIPRVQEAIEVVRALADAGAVQLHDTPLLREVLKSADSLEPAYLAHEFLPEHWRPAFHADVAADMARAQLAFVGSATLFENVPELCMDPAQKAVAERIPAGPVRELVKDICLTRPFRRDIFMRGVRRADRTALLDPVVLGLQVEAPSPPKLSVQVGTAEFGPEMAEPIMAALAEGPQTVGRLRNLPEGRKPNAAELCVLLCGTPTCLPMPPGSRDVAAAVRFNRAAAARYGYVKGPRLGICAPGAGAGIAAYALEVAIAADVGAFPDDTPGQRAMRLAADTSEASLRDATATIERVLRDRLAVWRRFGVVQP
ncbi:MAG: class I SAM-dependent methyltransferase [Acetobacteraceae bacterium]|nr:class I SAM-dependent methyltransferase [Acetobacteraceae bacterium]MCX7685322.1 class I SAM-dependent methyltransferase [Acetobacteraceae bacterium]MDW8397815.1 class I SAM-dependent methyltransferase [Acetobacteraceae bacterium]